MHLLFEKFETEVDPKMMQEQLKWKQKYHNFNKEYITYIIIYYNLYKLYKTQYHG